MLLLMRRLPLPLLVVVAALAYVGLVAPPAARAATCADYANQAAAQRAADTRDADGDAIYGEAPSVPVPEAGARRADDPDAPPEGAARSFGHARATPQAQRLPRARPAAGRRLHVRSALLAGGQGAGL